MRLLKAFVMAHILLSSPYANAFEIFFPDSYEHCLLKSIPRTEVNMAASVAAQLCRDQHPTIANIYPSFNEPTITKNECLETYAVNSKSQRGASLVRSACIKLSSNWAQPSCRKAILDVIKLNPKLSTFSLEFLYKELPVIDPEIFDGRCK